jgi:hypothetical protein
VHVPTCKRTEQQHALRPEALDHAAPVRPYLVKYFRTSPRIDSA